MAYPSVDTVAFSKPGGEYCVPSRQRPIDLVHLARQTLGDRDLEQEVLSLFLQQAVSVKDKIVEAEPAQRKFLAHGLKGGARGVGAFSVAEAAERVEEDPLDKRKLGRLASRIDEVREFMASINR
ncbi:Hpt domain-containing protein [Mesorhizobium xinjiangense]|uniref:Hpt domain-containing protein n=1 Tax=Mesorhizobium xinjiangense TaxID=2678685 RepID=UPI0012ED2ABA|nr:Hpt domain-containing protein [Mesorhizobium xinjiangense]